MNSQKLPPLISNNRGNEPDDPETKLRVQKIITDRQNYLKAKREGRELAYFLKKLAEEEENEPPTLVDIMMGNIEKALNAELQAEREEREAAGRTNLDTKGTALSTTKKDDIAATQAKINSATADTTTATVATEVTTSDAISMKTMNAELKTTADVSNFKDISNNDNDNDPEILAAAAECRSLVKVVEDMVKEHFKKPHSATADTTTATVATEVTTSDAISMKTMNAELKTIANEVSDLKDISNNAKKSVDPEVLTSAAECRSIEKVVEERVMKFKKQIGKYMEKDRFKKAHSVAKDQQTVLGTATVFDTQPTSSAPPKKQRGSKPTTPVPPTQQRGSKPTTPVPPTQQRGSNKGVFIKQLPTGAEIETIPAEPVEYDAYTEADDQKTTELDPATMTRNEKRVRRQLLKSCHGLQPMPEIKKIQMHKSNSVKIMIPVTDVYYQPASGTYVAFRSGEMGIREEPSYPAYDERDGETGRKSFKRSSSSEIIDIDLNKPHIDARAEAATARVVEQQAHNDMVVRGRTVRTIEESIECIMAETNCSYIEAQLALQENFDPVDAILALTAPQRELK